MSVIHFTFKGFSLHLCIHKRRIHSFVLLHETNQSQNILLLKIKLVFSQVLELKAWLCKQQRPQGLGWNGFSPIFMYEEVRYDQARSSLKGRLLVNKFILVPVEILIRRCLWFTFCYPNISKVYPSQILWYLSMKKINKNNQSGFIKVWDLTNGKAEHHR